MERAVLRLRKWGSAKHMLDVLFIGVRIADVTRVSADVGSGVLKHLVSDTDARAGVPLLLKKVLRHLYVGRILLRDVTKFF